MKKVLVANRGEIAIRAMRAAAELGLETVAVYTHADRDALHRVKADEAYEIGDPARPLAGYLDVTCLVDAAISAGADAVYPGYGFLSESAELAEGCAAAGLTFVGPPAAVLRLTGDKLQARLTAERAGIPVLRATGQVISAEDATSKAEQLGFPVFVKATSGGGGRGLRRVERPGDLAAAVETAQREAAAAFGDSTVFLEQALTRPRHIEVQILADGQGGLIHLFDRDCSVQRRHQKVIEIAPAPELADDVRQRLLSHAVRFAEAVGYVNAGTVEFLLDSSGRHVFIEMNPRIQVEHTVTEEVTDVDLVQAQLRIAAGETLDDLGLSQDRIRVRGTALQCRITTEDPSNGFRPATGTITAFRPAGGAGIRLDSASAHVGATVSPYFDALLVKMTARAPNLGAAAARASRALREFRVRGVTTNTAFLTAVLADPDFLAGRLDTSFIDDRPHLTAVDAGRDRATRLLAYIGEVTVHQPHERADALVDPATKLPPLHGDARPGTRQILAADGPEGLATWLRERTNVAVTDTTLRDAHQSILATRVRTLDLLTPAPHLSRVLSAAFSVEMWGGATFDAALRFLHEDPWDRLAALNEALPNVCLQMLLRGANAVGYSRYPGKVVRAFVAEAAAEGIDIFRIFDAQNDVGQMRDAIEAARDAGKVAEGTLCFTGNLADPAEQRYTLDYYLGLAEQLDAAGAHILCIKDMAGLLRPVAAARLITALRERFSQPVHLHTHDTAGGQLATYLAAVEAGVDAVDAAAAPLSGGTSQPSLSALVAALEHSQRPTGLDLDAIIELEPYWEAVRALYRPFEAGLESPSGAVYRHEIPGGQLSNLRQQAAGLGLGNRFEEIAEAYIQADQLLGRLIKVTPTSKVVGDLALYLLSSGPGSADAVAEGRGDLPSSVIGFLQGDLGPPPFGWPEPLHSRIVERHPPPPPPALSGDDDHALDDPDRRRDVLTRLLFGRQAEDQRAVEAQYGDVSRLPTSVFLYGLEPGEEVEIELEPGKRLVVTLEAIGAADDQGVRTLWCRVNGQLRPVDVVDRSIAGEMSRRAAADPSNANHVAATMTGVVTLTVAEGDTVSDGDTIAVVEAMKMESRVTTPHPGTVERVAVTSGTVLEPGDLIAVVAPWAPDTSSS